MNRARNFATGAWGRGVVRSAPDGVRGVSPVNPAGLTDAQLAMFLDASAREAIDRLALANEAVKSPMGEAMSFPGPIAERYYWDDGAVVGIQGPVGSGKTTTKMKRKLRRAIMMPKSTVDGWRRYKVMFTRETYRQLWSTTIPSYLEVYPRSLGEWSGGRGDPVTHRIEFQDEFGPIEFIAEFAAFGDNIVASMRGVQITDLDLNEADTMPVDILSVGIGRIDRYPARQHFAGLPDELRSYGQIDCDFNAPDEDSWTFKMFHDDDGREELLAAISDGGESKIRVSFHNQPGYGEPGCENLQNLSPDYYPRQLMANRLVGRGDMNERLVYNRVTTMRVGEPVFLREFSKPVHVRKQLEPWRDVPLRLGLDQGLKAAAVIVQFRPPYHWRFLEELHFPKERLLAREFGRRLGERLDDRRYDGLRIAGGWGDMAGEQSSSQADEENQTWNRIIQEVTGVRILPQRVGANRIAPRLEAVRSGFEFIHGGEPGILIDGSRCPLLVRGFEARYVWKDEVDRSGDKRKIPDKSFTEANVVDAGQYVMLSESKPDGKTAVTGSYGNEPGAGASSHGTSRGEGDLQTSFDVLDPYGD